MERSNDPDSSMHRANETVTPRTARRWLALVFIATGQCLIAIDVTVVTVALPSVDASLSMAQGSGQWVIAAYSLAFGALLLPGGRLADMFGHRRVLIFGMVSFCLASLLAGLAWSGPVILAARAWQGVSGALISPSALAMVSSTFTDERERRKAFGIYSAVASGGLALGFIVGGVVTQYLGWRWAFLLNVVPGVIAATGIGLTLPKRAGAPDARLDVRGSTLAVGCVCLLVIGVSRLGDPGGGGGSVMLLAGALVLVLILSRVERSARFPLLPPRVIANRIRVGVNGVMLFAIGGLFGLFMLSTYYFQTVRQFSPVESGLGFLPLVIALAAGSTVVVSRLAWLPPRIVIVIGFGLTVIATLMLTGLTERSSYVTLVVPVQVLLGIGLGLVTVLATEFATTGLDAEDSGIASAVFVTVQQVGAAVGTVLSSVTSRHGVAEYTAAHPHVRADSPEAVMAGFSSSLTWTGVVLVVGAVIAYALVTPEKRVSVGPSTA